LVAVTCRPAKGFRRCSCTSTCGWGGGRGGCRAAHNMWQCCRTHARTHARAPQRRPALHRRGCADSTDAAHLGPLLDAGVHPVARHGGRVWREGLACLLRCGQPHEWRAHTQARCASCLPRRVLPGQCSAAIRRVRQHTRRHQPAPAP
jgi:hypothetical protein